MADESTEDQDRGQSVVEGYMQEMQERMEQLREPYEEYLALRKAVDALAKVVGRHNGKWSKSPTGLTQRQLVATAFRDLGPGGHKTERVTEHLRETGEMAAAANVGSVVSFLVKDGVLENVGRGVHALVSEEALDRA